MSDTLKGAVVAILAGIAGSFATYWAQRAIDDHRTQQAALGSARVLRQELLLREQRAKGWAEGAAAIQKSINQHANISEAAGGGKVFPEGPFASFPRRMRLSFSGAASLPIEDRKLIAQRLDADQWTSVSTALRDLSEFSAIIRSFLNDIRPIAAKLRLTRRGAALYEARKVKESLRILEAHISDASDALRRLAGETR
jgi:hypothetical protein